MGITGRALRGGAAAALTAAVVLTTPAAASTTGVTAKEGVCALGGTLCNTTYGTGNSVGDIVAWRNTNVTAEWGFFEVYGPGTYKKTGPTDREADTTFHINGSWPRGSLLCVTFWGRSADGKTFTKYGGKNGNACTSLPIG